MTEPQNPTGRRRRRAHRPAGPPTESPASPPASDAVGRPAAGTAAAEREGTAKTPTQQPAGPARKPSGAGHKQGHRAGNRDSERGWRDLAGNSPSQVGVSGALRARDLARPTAEQLAAAETELVIVRRQWQPPDSAGG